LTEPKPGVIYMVRGGNILRCKNNRGPGSNHVFCDVRHNANDIYIPEADVLYPLGFGHISLLETRAAQARARGLHGAVDVAATAIEELRCLQPDTTS